MSPLIDSATEDRGIQRCELEGVSSDEKEHWLHPPDAGRTSDPRRDDHSIHRLTVIGRASSALQCGGWRTLGLASVMKHLGFTMQPELRADGTAASGLASHRGAGQVRHIRCPASVLAAVHCETSNQSRNAGGSDPVTRHRNENRDTRSEDVGPTLSARMHQSLDVAQQWLWETS